MWCSVGSGTLPLAMGAEDLSGDSRGYEKLWRTVSLPILPTVLALEPLFVLLSVGHGGPFEGLGLLL